MTRQHMRPSWFELDDDRLVIAKIIVTDSDETCLEQLLEPKLMSHNTKPLLRLFIQIHSSHKLTIFEKPLSDIHRIVDVAENLIGIVPGPEQKQTVKYRVDVDWVGRITAYVELTAREHNWYILAAGMLVGAIIGDLTGLMGRCRYKHILNPLLILPGYAYTIFAAYKIYKSYKNTCELKEISRQIFPSEHTSFTIDVHPAQNIAPILWNETILPLRKTFASVKLTQLTKCKFQNKNQKPRLLCSYTYRPFLQIFTRITTPSGKVIKHHPWHDEEQALTISKELVLPDIQLVNAKYEAEKLREKRRQFKTSGFFRELIAAAWHPRRVAAGLIDPDS